jgi:flagellar export protein FliJ
MLTPRDFQKYEPLRRVRQRQEDQKSVALAETRREIARRRAQAQAIANRQRELLVEAHGERGPAFSVAQIRPFYEYERHLSNVAVRNDAEIERLKRVEANQLEELREATKRRRMVEVVMDRRRTRYLEEERRREQRALDEAATGRAALQRAFGRTRTEP